MLKSFKELKCDKIQEIADEMLRGSPDIREGQALFCALDSIDRKTANKIACTDFDPFYDDGKIPMFWARVKG